MKNPVIVGCCAAAAFGLLIAAEGRADPKELRYGFWIETYRGFDYIVDTKAQLCFMRHMEAESMGVGMGVVTVPCESLAKREEWTPILDWLEDAPPAPDESPD